MPPRRKKLSTAAKRQRKTTRRSKKGAPPIPVEETKEAEDPQNAALEETVLAKEEATIPDESTVEEEASIAIGKEEHRVPGESTIGAAVDLQSKDAVLELSLKVEGIEEELSAAEENVTIKEQVPMAGNAVFEPYKKGEVKTVMEESKVSETQEAVDDFIREPEEIELDENRDPLAEPVWINGDETGWMNGDKTGWMNGDKTGCPSMDADEGVHQEMVEEENEVYDNEAAEGGEDEETMDDEVDDDSENDDQEADEGTGEEEEDTGVGEVANSLAGEDDSDDDEDGGGGSNDEDEEGMEVEDDESGSNGEDDEWMEEENVEGGSNDDDDDEGTEDGDEEGENYDEDDEGTEDEEDPSESMHASLTNRKKGAFEIFVSRLDKKTVEDDLQKAFAPFGEIQTVRIVRHPVTQKSKGFAFIRYAAAEHAKKALSELKDGAEVKGKLVRILASQDNDTLFVGNICKTWTKDHVLATLKRYGIEQIEEIVLPDDPKKEGSSKGFAFLEFGAHSDAMAAFQRLRKPDAVFGCDRSAKVAFTQSLPPSEEALSRVKTVFVDGLPASWDEDKLEEQCKKYGKIEEVRVPRKSGKKHRGFGFVEFSTRESAIACVKGINDDKLGDGEIKVKANIAKPQNKGRLAKIGARGGFKVENNEENAEANQPNPEPNPKAKTGKEKVKSHAKSKNSKGSKPSKGKCSNGQGGGPSQAPKEKEQELKGQGGSSQAPQRKKRASKGQGCPSQVSERKMQASKGQDGGPSQDSLKKKQQQRGSKRSSRGTDSIRPSKRARHRSNLHGRPTQNFGQRKSRFGQPKTFHTIHQAVDRDPYAPMYVAPAVNYQGLVYHESRYSYSDMKPHAGYLENAVDRVRDPYAYEGRSAVGYDSQGRAAGGYIVGSVPSSSHVYPYSNYPGYEASYGRYPRTTAHPPRRLYY